MLCDGYAEIATQSIAGLVPDGRVLVNRAREESRGFLKNYGTKMTGDILCERIAGYMHVYSLYEWLRPFGCGVMIACWDEAGPSLYVVEPDGSGYKYYGCALGKAKQQARTMIESLDLSELTVRYKRARARPPALSRPPRLPQL